MRARKVDANYNVIADEFERLGCRVHRTNADWDLTVKYCDITRTVEVKNPQTSYGKKGLNAKQKKLTVEPYLIRDVQDVKVCVESMVRYQRYVDEGIRRELLKESYVNDRYRL